MSWAEELGPEVLAVHDMAPDFAGAENMESVLAGLEDTAFVLAAALEVVVSSFVAVGSYWGSIAGNP